MSDALPPYPKEWSQLLRPFDQWFSKPQFKNFCHATTAMVVSEHSSIRRWASFGIPKHQSTLNDFFTRSPWQDERVAHQLTVMTFARVKDARTGVLDDTFSHHPYAKKMDYAGWFHDGLSKKEQHGHNIVTHGVHSVQLGFIPLQAVLYRKGGLTKNDIACQMIERTERYQHLPLYLMDSWYSNVQVIGTIKRFKSHYITEIKSNRNVTIGNHKRWAREHFRLIKTAQWHTIKIRDSTYRYFQTSAHIKGLGSVNLVFSQFYDEKKRKWKAPWYLITDLLTLPGERAIELFLLRNGIEGFHRESKQQLGFEQYQLRNARGIERYLFLVVLVYTLLLLLQQQRMKQGFEHQSIGELREHVQAACYTLLLQEARRGDDKYIEITARRMAYAL